MTQKQKNDFIFTNEGLEALKKELQILIDNKRPKIIERVSRARDFGDLSENAEYSNAREELALIEGRIDELENLISRAKVINSKQLKGSKNSVKEITIGCRVTITMNGTENIFTIVGEWEADPMNKKISHNSPLGKALLGKKIGEQVEIEAPAGKVLYSIKKIE
ncbi:MAG: transcription elongation factor GreA [Parcubacteria group bacterium CG10_big_fil_rev_8_21_14_0_10_35_15]|nr:MAG: transcription elongation factor GreA [Parcubacteria group bacterium CG10_big_fil_rev_8_21_14_0_10_35_15]